MALDINPRIPVKPYWNAERTEYAVLHTTTYGTGWGGEPRNPIELAYDRDVIDFWLQYHDVSRVDIANVAAADARFDKYRRARLFKFLNFYGWESLDVEWVLAGVRWKIAEYDGLETIRYFGSREWICFK